MKRILILLAVGLALTGYSQSTSTNAPTIPNAWDNIVSFVSAGSNWIVAPYGIYATGGFKNTDPSVKVKNSYGFGVAGLYKINDYVLTGLGLDYMNGGLTMPSATAQLQYPIKVASFIVTPLAYSGIATSIGGDAKNNGEAIGIFGTGAAVSFTKHFGAFGSYEKRTSFEGNWVKGGVFIKF